MYESVNMIEELTIEQKVDVKQKTKQVLEGSA